MPAPLTLLPSPKAKEPPSSRSCSTVLVLLTSEGWWRREKEEEASEVGKLVLSLQAAHPLPGSSLLRSSGMKCLFS